MEGMDSNLITVLITIVTVLTSGAAWQFYEKRMKLNADQEATDKKEHLLFRDDLRERVAILESKLEESQKEKVELLESLRTLSEQTAALRVEVEFLKKENERLHEELKARTP